ncbi:hypothetical protein [Brucella pseudogrignonensis]|uniref:hypothetical protein n=1 Tax=Brucella pseudogrignonensis TaxID=419475 RepID=UPI00148D07A2|nr:hypothetical protein [Brucella pseudogrignonensis]
MFQAYKHYAEGRFGVQVLGPADATAFISTQPISEAIVASLANGENGKTCLIGD